jgi:hypothetical protein
VITEAGSAQTLGFGKIPARKSEAESQDISPQTTALSPSSPQHPIISPTLMFSISTAQQWDLDPCEVEDLEMAADTLTCLHSSPGIQTQPWKRVPCEIFSPKA